MNATVKAGSFGRCREGSEVVMVKAFGQDTPVRILREVAVRSVTYAEVRLAHGGKCLVRKCDLS